MSLPSEVRCFIHECCLVVGKIFPFLDKQQQEEKEQATGRIPTTTLLDPMAEEKSKYPTPDLGLLSVNKVIYAETVPFVFQKNTVVLPNAQWTARLFQNCLDSKKERLWLKDVELQLCKSDMPASARDHFAHAHTPASSSSQLHDSWKRYLGHTIWPAKMAFTLDDTDLKTLTVDLRQSFCPASCCACQSRALTSFRKGFASGRVPDLRFKGVLRLGTRCTQCVLPTRPDVKESDFANMAVATVTVGGRPLGRVPVAELELRRAVRIGGQIARWTRARGLMGMDYGDYKWMMEEARLDDAHTSPYT